MKWVVQLASSKCLQINLLRFKKIKPFNTHGDSNFHPVEHLQVFFNPTHLRIKNVKQPKARSKHLQLIYKEVNWSLAGYHQKNFNLTSRRQSHWNLAINNECRQSNITNSGFMAKTSHALLKWLIQPSKYTAFIILFMVYYCFWPSLSSEKFTKSELTKWIIKIIGGRER